VFKPSESLVKCSWVKKERSEVSTSVINWSEEKLAEV
jgi:hypothetical protein